MNRTLFQLLVLLPVVYSRFEPYQLNGGLVTAVAGKNYVILATDTRMIGPGGYDILTRKHLSSRIWAVSDPLEEEDSSTLTNDGSIQMDFKQSEEIIDESATSVLKGAPAVMIASSGCDADCQMLKRHIRADLRKAHFWSEAKITPTQTATLLSQILYSRRGFPYYSFCVLAGLERQTGHVYVYDAIGSYECVAVGTAGTGRELLQPILDRKFRTLRDPLAVMVSSETSSMDQLSTSSQVHCSKEESMDILIEGYRSVSEREIGVGDYLVMCILERSLEGTRCTTRCVSLKKH